MDPAGAIAGAERVRWLDGWLEVDGSRGTQRWRVDGESLVLLGGPLRAVAPGFRAFAAAVPRDAAVLVERRGGRLAVAVAGASPMSGAVPRRVAGAGATPSAVMSDAPDGGSAQLAAAVSAAVTGGAAAPAGVVPAAEVAGAVAAEAVSGVSGAGGWPAGGDAPQP